MPTKLKVSYGPFLTHVSLVTLIVPNFHSVTNKKVVIFKAVDVAHWGNEKSEVVFASSACISVQKQTHLI